MITFNKYSNWATSSSSFFISAQPTDRTDFLPVCYLAVAPTYRETVAGLLAEYAPNQQGLQVCIVDDVTSFTAASGTVLIEIADSSFDSTPANVLIAATTNSEKATIGFQRHLLGQGAIDLPASHTSLSLGKLRSHPYLIQPILSDKVIVDWAADAVRASDIAADVFPTGLTAEESCQIARYLGEADAFSRLLLRPPLNLPTGKQWARLYLSIIWYVIEGVANRKNDHPGTTSDYQKYVIAGEDGDYVFVQGVRSARWWLVGEEGAEVQYIPCALVEYESARSTGQLTDRLLAALDDV